MKLSANSKKHIFFLASFLISFIPLIILISLIKISINVSLINSFVYFIECIILILNMIIIIFIIYG